MTKMRWYIQDYTRGYTTNVLRLSVAADSKNVISPIGEKTSVLCNAMKYRTLFSRSDSVSIRVKCNAIINPIHTDTQYGTLVSHGCCITAIYSTELVWNITMAVCRTPQASYRDTIFRAKEGIISHSGRSGRPVSKNALEDRVS